MLSRMLNETRGGHFQGDQTLVTIEPPPSNYPTTSNNGRGSLQSSTELRPKSSGQNVASWIDQGYILNALGVQVLQELLYEEHRPLSSEETELLKRRFRRRFKPTDGAVLNKLREKGWDDSLPLPISAQILSSPQASPIRTTDGNWPLVRGHEALRTTAQQNRRLWRDKPHILKVLGVQRMQTLLGEVQKPLSVKETYALKQRFRRRFKPTDDVIARTLRTIREGHISPSQALPPMQSTTPELDTHGSDPSHDLPDVHTRSALATQHPIRNLQERATDTTARSSETSPDTCFEEPTTPAMAPTSQATDTEAITENNSAGCTDEGMCIPNLNKRRRLNDKTNVGPAESSEKLPDIRDAVPRSQPRADPTLLRRGAPSPNGLSLEDIFCELQRVIQDLNTLINEINACMDDIAEPLNSEPYTSLSTPLALRSDKPGRLWISVPEELAKDYTHGVFPLVSMAQKG
mmetsp:Transcript_84669/g.235774  ORF Transcript_84669/g.235774 Transcript_84669/m.235774 type:complete len:462 (+) Transcript_84669:335-1720(+)